MGDVFLLAFVAALYPTLLAATTVMLMLPHPKRLLFGYLLAPDWTPKAVARFRDAVSRRGRDWAVRGAAIAGVLLIVRGVAALLASA